MATNPVFEGLLEEMRALHQRKNADYASTENPYSNFEFAAAFAEGFSDPVDRVFATMIGVKAARLQELTKPGREAHNESVEDTRVDLANYATIWASYRRYKREEKEDAARP